MKIIPVKFNVGWIEFQVTSDSVSYDVRGSNVLADPLTNLLNAVLLLNEGEPRVYVEFWEESHSIIWHLEQRDRKLFIYQHYEKDAVPWDGLLERLPRRAFFRNTIETDLNNFTRQVRDLFTYLWNEHGPEEYGEIWNHDFPLEKYEKLLKLS